MKRFAPRLREHGGEDRFGDELRDTIADLNALQLLMLELAMSSWWDS